LPFFPVEAPVIGPRKGRSLRARESARRIVPNERHLRPNETATPPRPGTAVRTVKPGPKKPKTQCAEPPSDDSPGKNHDVGAGPCALPCNRAGHVDRPQGAGPSVGWGRLWPTEGSSPEMETPQVTVDERRKCAAKARRSAPVDHGAWGAARFPKGNYPEAGLVLNETGRHDDADQTKPSPVWNRNRGPPLVPGRKTIWEGRQWMGGLKQISCHSGFKYNESPWRHFFKNFFQSQKKKYD